MTLEGTIAAVPQLGSSCSKVLEDFFGVPGSGIKLMRLVSKQLRVAMLGMVQGYTLLLNGSGEQLLKEMALFQNTRLSCLRVIVSHERHGELVTGFHTQCCVFMLMSHSPSSFIHT